MVKNGLYREEYLQIGDFSMKSGYIMMKEILKLDKKESLFLSHYDPESVNYLVNHKI